VEGYLINEGLLSTYVGKCAAQGGHREVNAPCAYEGATLPLIPKVYDG